MPWRKPIRWSVRHSAFSAFLLAVILSSALAVYLNDQRVNDIQKDRVKSCQRTYEGVREVFKPFFRTKRLRTEKEQANVDKFNARIDELKAGCGDQTGVSDERS